MSKWLNEENTYGDKFGDDRPAPPVPGGAPTYHSPDEKKAFLARYYAAILTGRQRPPPPPAPRRMRPPPASQAMPTPAPTSASQGLSLSQLGQMASSAANVASEIAQDPNLSASATINGEFFDDELSWDGHRHYPGGMDYHTSPLGARDPFTNAHFGVDAFGFDEEFMSASNQLPAFIFAGEEALLRDYGVAGLSPTVDASTVHAVQAKLNANGFGPLRVDGIMGPKTAKALVKFAKTVNLPLSEVDILSPSILMALGVVPGGGY